MATTKSHPLVEIIKRSARERHLEQLSHFNLVANPSENVSTSPTYDDLVQWSKESIRQITAGVQNRAYGGQAGSPIDFNNAFLAFMESAAMYLRDVTTVVQACRTYGSNRGDEHAFRLLEESTSQIDSLAELWGMDFIQICDFVERHPDGQSYLVGPFCGAFIPKNFTGNSPFIGIAFKGTSVTGEIINDLMANVTLRPSGYLWGTEVSAGFYYSIFSSFNSTASNQPFLLIQRAVRDIVQRATTAVVTHVTGHSLGGAYGTLTYAQLSIAGYGTPIATLGDLYTFASPRVGRGEFAGQVKASVNTPTSVGSTWRIVNDGDYVPEVPASPPWPFSRNPFMHIDSAYKIYPSRSPSRLPSEIGTNPTWRVPTGLAPHSRTEYYKSLTYATTQSSPRATLPSGGEVSLAMATFDPSIAVPNTKPLDDACTPAIELQNHREYIVGTIQHECLYGKITALGNIKTLNRDASFHYHRGTNSASLKVLYSKENQCTFSLVDQKTLEISFFVDAVKWAYARVSSADEKDIGDLTLSRGSCVWSFSEHDGKLNAIASDIEAKAASIFESKQLKG